MANNYQDNFTLTASWDVIRGKEGEPLQTHTLEKKKRGFLIDAVILGNLYLSIYEKHCVLEWFLLCLSVFLSEMTKVQVVTSQ